MHHKQLLTLFVLVLVLVFALPVNVLADEAEATPHEDPDSADIYYDGIAILGYYADMLNHVLTRVPERVELLREKGPFANVPDRLRDSLDSFGEASVEIAALIVEVEVNLDELNWLASQVRIEEMEELKGVTRDGLKQAYAELLVIETSAAIAREKLAVPDNANEDPLRRAYDELEGKIEDLRILLELLQNLLGSTPESSLLDILGVTLDELMEMPLDELMDILRMTEISLEVETTVGFVGDWISIEGDLNSEGDVLADRQVAILLDGIPYVTMRTDSYGAFQGQLQLPYEYVAVVTLEALYYPQDSDIGLYLASKSDAVVIEVLFYTADLQLGIEGKAYPGLNATVAGRFDYGEDPVPEVRNLQIYLDGRLMADVSVGQSFEQIISLKPDITLGEHRLLVVAPSQERHASVRAESFFEVVTVVPVIDLTPPKLAIMPFGLKVSGKVYSELGPLADAPIEASFGAHNAQTVTAEDGSFSVNIETGLNISLIGSEELEVEVYPESPWIARAGSSWNVIAINPIAIFFVVLVIVPVMIVSGKRLRSRKARRRAGPGVTAPVPTTALMKLGKDISDEGSGEVTIDDIEENKDRRFIFSMYTKLLGLIQDFTGAVLKPQTTYREFMLQSGPKLGPAFNYLYRFTRLIERLLYSKSSVEAVDIDKSRELNRQVEESIAHERS